MARFPSSDGENPTRLRRTKVNGVDMSSRPNSLGELIDKMAEQEGDEAMLYDEENEIPIDDGMKVRHCTPM